MKGTAKRIIKKTVAVVLALAMVITGISYTPSVANAADEWTTLSGFSLQKDGATDLSYRVVVGSETGGIYVYGLHYMHVYPDKTTEPTAIYFDEGLTTEGTTEFDGWINQIAGNNIQFGFGLNSERSTGVFNKDSYYSLRLVYSDGDVVFQFKVGNPATEEETTTPAEEESTTPTEEETTTPTQEETESETSSEENLTWKTNDYLTAALGEGTMYAESGSVPDGEMQIQESQLWWISGANLSSITLSVNGTIPDGCSKTDNSALGHDIQYSALTAGINTIEIVETDSAGTEYKYTFYVKVPVTTTNVYINDYSTYTGKYIVKFDEVENAVSYNVYIDGDSTAVTTLGGSGDYISYDDLSAYAEGSHTVALTAVYSDGSETAKSKTVTINKPSTAGSNNDIAQIYVQTDDTSVEALNVIKDAGKLKSSITAVDNQGTYSDVYDDASKTTIKVRGNSTANADKKAYNISFSKKTNLFGLSGEGESGCKKWSLLANAFDKSLVRNKIVMDFANTAGVMYNSESRYIDLYLNGRYMGNYLCIESVEVDTTRVDIASEDETDPTNSDILLELDSNGRDLATDAHLWNPDATHPGADETSDTTAGEAWSDLTTRYGLRFAVNSPEGDPSSPSEYITYTDTYATKMGKVFTLLNAFETALDGNDYDTIASYIDVDSFVNYYIVNEFFKNQDINFSSTRFFIKKGMLYAGPCWDFDLSSGNVSLSYYSETDQSPEGYKATDLVWFEKLMNNATFLEKVKARYKELLPTIRALYADGGTIDSLVSSISDSATRNYTSLDAGGAGWSLNTKDSGDGYSNANTVTYDNYDSYIADFKTWVAKRESFLTSEWLNEKITVTVSDGTDGANAGDVVASWTAVDGATGYLLTYTPFVQTSAVSTFAEIYSETGDNIVSALSSNTASVLVTDGTSYNFTQNNILLESGSTVSVAYTTDENPSENSTFSSLADTYAEASLDVTTDVTVDEMTATVTATITNNGTGVAENVAVTLGDQSDIITSLAAGGTVTKTFKITETTNGKKTYELTVGSTTYSISYRIGEEAAPDLTDVKEKTAEETNWIDPSAANNCSTTNSDGTIRYYVASTFVNGSSNDALGGTGVWGVGTAQNITYAGGTDNTISGEALAFASNTMRASGEGVDSVWLDGVQLTEGTQWYHSNTNDDVMTIAASAFNMGEDAEKIFYITIRTNLENDYSFPVKLVNLTVEETTTEAETTIPGETETAPEGATWTYFAESKEYSYYIPTEAQAIFKIAEGQLIYEASGLYFGMLQIPSDISINGTSVSNLEASGAHMRLAYENFPTNGIYRITFTANSTEYTIYVKKATPVDYTPTGLTAYVDSSTSNAVVSWEASDDAVAAGDMITYEVMIGEDTATVTGTTATLDMTGKDYGTYTVTLSTLYNGEVVDTETCELKYKDPSAIESDVTFNERWAYTRSLYISWTEVGVATGYAVYGDDGALLMTLPSGTLSADVYAYNYANGTNASGQATCIGDHTATVVALINDETAPEALSDVAATQILDSYDFYMHVNYVFGNMTDKWNATADSVWNFTLSEVADDSINIKRGSDTKVEYADDGSIKLTINDVGLHSTYSSTSNGDQAWTIKASIYDQECTKGDNLNLVFDIIGGTDLIGKDIQIKWCPEEMSYNADTDTWYYSGEEYINKTYTFEAVTDDDGNAVGSVLHFDEAATMTNNTYDLFFGLGLLSDDPTAEEQTPIEFTISDAQETTLYGVDSVAATGIYNDEDGTNSSIYVSWITNVPNALRGYYTYQLYIDDKLVSDDATSGQTYAGYEPGEHTIKVTSTYTSGDTTEVTSEKSTQVTIEQTDKPDLVISDIYVDPDSDMKFEGETVTAYVTMKNIGTLAADSTAGNMTIYLYLDVYNSETDETESNLIGWRYINSSGDFIGGNVDQTGGYDGDGVLESGESVTFMYENAIIWPVADTKYYTLRAVADADSHVDELNEDNNTNKKTYYVYDHLKELTLTNDGSDVVATWPECEDADSYYIEYTDYQGNVRSNTVKSEKKALAYAVGNGNTVSVYAVINGEKVPWATAVAQADLVYDKLYVDGNSYAGETTNVVAVVKNVGTAAANANDQMLAVTVSEYGSWNYGSTNTILLPDADLGDNTATITIGIVIDTEGTYTAKVQIDDANRIDESNTDNNIEYLDIITVNKEVTQDKMDWTPLYDAEDSSTTYEFSVANSSQTESIEYKVLDTSYTDISYKDLITTYSGYANSWMSIGIDNSHTTIQVNSEEGKSDYSYTNMWFEQVQRKYLVDDDGNATDNVDITENGYLSMLSTQGCDVITPDGTVLEKTSETPLVYNGNGFLFNANSFAPGKYYIMKVVNYDESGTQLNYVTLAFRVTSELEGWARVGASDSTNIDALAAFYHDSDHQVNAKFYYDNSDLGLACIVAYNGSHLTLTTDTSKKFNDDVNKTKIEIAYGEYNATTKTVTEPANWDDVCVNPGIYGKEGTNNLQIEIAKLMNQLPIHSANGGSTDRGYYFMKVYYDTENAPDSYIPVPMLVIAEIPEIIPVQGLDVSNRGSMMTVSWTSTNTQITDGYLYDIYIDNVLEEENVMAGSYNFSGSGEIGEEHTVKVVAKWCEQTSEAEVTYTMQPPETDPAETIPGDGTDTVPEDSDTNQWVRINGQSTLPVTDGRYYDGTTINAEIWYYTDEDINSVAGYNDNYISISGSEEYFTGSSTRLYVEDYSGNNTFVSKTIYDKYYEGMIQMNAAEMFTTYGDTYDTGTEMYYLVRIAGNNGNTYKDFYFKVVLTEETSIITNTGDWRLISGESNLPVMSDNTNLQGSVSFLDCPNATDKYTTGTNTYDIVGYNGYYMSIIGDTTYYTGEDTTISVSEAKDTAQYAEDAANLTFTDKEIYDKVYPGQIIIKCADTFSVEYATTYYLLKVQSAENVTYIPVKVEVNTGTVDVLGFQMNTNQESGGVSEFNPSFRVVSKSANVMTTNDNQLHSVQKMGTIYALADEMTDMDADTIKANMTLDGAESNDFIQSYERTDKGKLEGYTTTESDSAYNTYFALTFQYKSYMYNTLEQNYTVRAYAVLDDGTVVYGDNIYTTNMYEIADNLYTYQKMGTMVSHDFLYDNILNPVDMLNHRSQIANAMIKCLGITSYSDEKYSLVKTMADDLFYYVKCQNGYTYKDRGQFTCSVEDELLSYLKNTSSCTSVYEWIYNNVSNYSNNSGIAYEGCHKLVDYGWDNSFYKPGN